MHEKDPENDLGHERVLDIGDFLPGVAYTSVNLEVIPGIGITSFYVGMQLGCENCDPIESNSFRILQVNVHY